MIIFRGLCKSAEVEIEGRTYYVKYYLDQGLHRFRRYQAEIPIGPTDRIVFDATSLIELEVRVAKQLPDAIRNRKLIQDQP